MKRPKLVGPKPPTEKMMQAFDAIREFIRVNGYSPTAREIGERLQVGPGTILWRMKALAKRGLIIYTPGKARTIKIVGGGKAA